MSRKHPSRIARSALARWLSVVLALTGLGVLHGAHCADELTQAALSVAVGDHTQQASAVTRTAIDALPAPVTELTRASDGDGQGGHRQGSPGTVAGACLFLLAAVIGAALVHADALSRVLRLRPGGAGFAPPTGRWLPTVDLSRIGVLRT